MKLRVDLNCDLGEGAGHDAELMRLVSSANVACGGHAGDQASMVAAVELAKAEGVAVGAHPGFPDREHFGRRDMAATPAEVKAWIKQQVCMLQRVATDLGVDLAHVKPHGALYNLAARDEHIAGAVAAAVAEVDRGLILLGLAGSHLIAAGRRNGLRVANEVFADRGYGVDGALLPRSHPGALLTDPLLAARRVLDMLQQESLAAVDGTRLPVRADTICLHGDSAHAVEFAREVRAALQRAGIRIAACGEEIPA